MPSVTYPNFCPEGPRNARIMIVGEALGEQEEMFGKPFVGASGKELTRMLSDAGIRREDCYLTNVFWRRPPNNKLDKWCGTKKEAGQDYEGTYPHPPVKSGKYVRRQWIEDVTEADNTELGSECKAQTVFDRLAAEIAIVQPNIIIALGNTPCWALLGTGGISKIRGTLQESTLAPGVKVLPTYHPAYVLRVWNHRPVVLADLAKAKWESGTDELVRPQRWIHVEPTLGLLRDWVEELSLAPVLSYDVETERGQITCIGFSPHPQEAFVIPLWDKRRPGYSYWPPHVEAEVWQLIRQLMEGPAVKLAQNGLYDAQYLYRTVGIRPFNQTEDTMILHHALHPEMEKSLGFMGSVYTNEAAWKNLRGTAKTALKRED